MCVFKPKIPKAKPIAPPPTPNPPPEPPDPPPAPKPLEEEGKEARVSYGSKVRAGTNQRSTGTESLKIPLNTGQAPPSSGGLTIS